MQYFASFFQLIPLRFTLVVLLVLFNKSATASADVPGNVLLNSDISDGDATAPSVWEKACVPARDLKMERVKRGSSENDWCLTIKNQHNYERSVSNNWRQTVSEDLRGRQIQLSAMIRTSEPNAANVCVQCWDESGEKLLAFGSTPVLQKSRDWIVLRSEPVFVPEATATVVVRAALTGTGQAWFDNIELNMVEQTASKNANRQDDETKTRERELEKSLIEKVGVRILNAYSFEKDCVVISYMENWAHGHVDHIAVADNNGGVRTLLNWSPVSDAEASRKDLRFFAAIYSRETISGSENREISIRSITETWPESTSWKTRPKLNDDAITQPFSTDDGWQLFDVTPFVRDQNKNHGVMIGFSTEQPASVPNDNPQPFSAYQFVSHEAEGDLFSKRPVLLVVQPDEAPNGNAIKIQETSAQDTEIARWVDRMGRPQDKNFEALNKLIQIGSASTKPVATIFVDKSETLLRRWQSAMVLGKVGGDKEVALMLDALNEKGNDDEETLRKVIVEALLPRANSEVDRKLKAMVEDPETPEPLTDFIKEKLADPKSNGNSNAQTDEEIAKWVDQMGSPQDKSFEALNKLIQIGPPAAIPVAAIFADKSESPIRRWQSAMVLGKVGGEKEVGHLLDALHEKGAKVEMLQKVIIEAILPRANAEVDRKLKAMVEDPETPESLRKFIKEKLADPKSNPLLPDVWEGEFAWVESFVNALKQAKDQDKLVMTIVYANQSNDVANGQLDGSAIPYHTLLRGPLTDPDLKTLIENYFVVHKRAFHIHEFSLDIKRARDPLADLGTNTRETQPPAILLHDANGRLLQRITSIGTFNARLLHAALTTVLKEAKVELEANRMIDLPADIPDEFQKAWVKAKLHSLSGDTDLAIREIQSLLSQTDDDSVKAILKSLGGKILHHEGRKDDAAVWLQEAIESGIKNNQLGEAFYWLLDCKLTTEQRQATWLAAEAWQQDNADSIWSRKIAMRTPSAEIHMATAESFGVIGVNLLSDVRHDPEQLDEVVTRALRFLVESQASEGYWRPLEGQSQAFTQVAVTAICASAIRQWRNKASALKLPKDLDAGLGKSEIAARAAIVRYAKQISERKRQDYSQVWNQTYALEYLNLCLADRLEGDELNVSETKQAAQWILDDLLKHQYAEGGWSYLPPTSAKRWGGIRPHSFNTAPILMELVEAKRLGLKLDQFSIDKAVESLESVRSESGAFAYAPADGFVWMTKQRCAIARDPLCELALNRSGKDNKQDLIKSLERFHRHRSDLEIPRKLYASYFNTNGHGAYFYAFGYFYASEVIEHLPKDRKANVARDIQSDLLSIVELDGTWIDMHAQGKTYATGMILRALFNTR